MRLKKAGISDQTIEVIVREKAIETAAFSVQEIVDMKNAGLSSVECHLITKLVYQANSLDEEKLKRAREVFLVGRDQGQSESSGPTTAQENTPSGEPAQE